jgi:hypothetical protein
MKAERFPFSAFRFHNSSFVTRWVFFNSLVLAILHLLGSNGFAAASAFDDARAIYERGDYAQALKLFRQLAEDGHQWAQRRVGLMYAEGQGTAQDHEEAAKWYRLAAAQGEHLAQISLGAMYASGTGVAQDLVRAHMWFALATRVSTGNARDRATENRDSIASKMTPEEIASAQEMALRCQESKLKKCD